MLGGGTGQSGRWSMVVGGDGTQLEHSPYIRSELPVTADVAARQRRPTTGHTAARPIGRGGRRLVILQPG
jgi:hypothetical protein